MLVGVENIVSGFWLVIGVFSSIVRLMQDRHADGQDKRKLIERREREIEKQRKRLEKKLQKQERQEAQRAKKEERETRKPEPKPEPKPAPVVKEKKKSLKEVMKKTVRKETPVTASGAVSNYKLPPIDLLDQIPPQTINVDVEKTTKIMIETLADFGIEAEVTNVEKGPVVTRYEILPAAGVRVEKIAGLANNLALSLKSHNVRVQAPVPGKGVVGVEVPNLSANMVNIRHVVESKEWQTGEAHVPLALGQDVGGNVIIADLAKMPHLLVAGATGAGKTVCMNTLLTGLLMAKAPDELRLILVDPKIVEFAMYNDLPHLVVPVITDPKKVSLGLRWAINEMEKRYKLFAKVGVRNIESYNTREVATQEDLFSGGEGDEKKKAPPAKIPYIVIVIDELADLMLVDQAEIENCVARLAQLSRAVGIHMIISTQRPSVNVITGTIKANFPARIAFQVAQKTDSRTILDASGAEKLLGKGDMLFLLPGANKMIRSQGAWTSDPEMKKVVDFVKAQAGPSFDVEIKQKLEKKTVSGMDSGEDDELLIQAIEIIRETRRASTSSLQRRLRIGYTRAARMIDILEERGVIGPPRGSDPREILVDLDGEIPQNDADDEAFDEPVPKPQPEPEETVVEEEEVQVEDGDDFNEEINYVADDEVEDTIVIEENDDRS
jgi:S-DNA-T family DNA segregation ATPase FtsK/SpoIIIE